MENLRFVALAAAAALGSAGPAAAQPGALVGFSGSWRAAIGAAGFSIAAVEGGQALGADQPGDPILGVFQTDTEHGTEFWAWRQSNADLSSKALRDTLAAPGTQRVRQMNSFLPKAGPGAWAVMSRPTGTDGKETPAFLFTGDKSEVYSVDIPQEKVYGKDAEKVRLPLRLSRNGESLAAVYGAPESGLTEVHRFSAKGDQLLGFFEFRADPATKKPALTRGRVYGDPSALDELFAQPGADTAGMKALKGNKDLVDKMGAALSGGSSLTVTFDRFGNGQLTRHAGPDDKEGSPFIYLIGGQAMEAEATK